MGRGLLITGCWSGKPGRRKYRHVRDQVVLLRSAVEFYGDILGYSVRRSVLMLESQVSFSSSSFTYCLESIFLEFFTSDLEPIFIISRLH